MAKELRTVHLQVTSTTTANNSASFVNTSDGLMHVRRVEFNGIMSEANGEASFLAQLSKEIARVDRNGEVGFYLERYMTPDAVGTAPTTDAGGRTSGSWLFAKGQVTLEPAEGLYAHVEQGANNSATLNQRWTIFFEVE